MKSMDLRHDWKHSVLSQCRDRDIAFDAVTELFNATVEMTTTEELISGEHFSNESKLTPWGEVL